MPAPRRKERTFRLPDDFSLSNFTDKELRSRYRFGQESIEFLSELLRDDLERDTSRNHALSTTVQVLVHSIAPFRLRKLYRRYSGLVKVIPVPYNQLSFASPCIETKNFIKWPSTEKEILQNKRSSFTKVGFPEITENKILLLLFQ